MSDSARTVGRACAGSGVGVGMGFPGMRVGGENGVRAVGFFSSTTIAVLAGAGCQDWLSGAVRVQAKIASARLNHTSTTMKGKYRRFTIPFRDNLVRILVLYLPKK